MKHIYKLSIECVFGAYLEERFLRVVEVPSDMTLGDMHFLMLDLAGFDNDHMSTFYMANSLGGKKIYFTEDGEWEETHDEMMPDYLWNIPLHNVWPLPKHKKPYYLFDYGDAWTFDIRKKGKEAAPVAEVNYPRIIQEEGPKPDQYPAFDG